MNHLFFSIIINLFLVEVFIILILREEIDSFLGFLAANLINIFVNVVLMSLISMIFDLAEINQKFLYCILPGIVLLFFIKYGLYKIFWRNNEDV